MPDFATTMNADVDDLARATAAASAVLLAHGSSKKAIYDFELVVEELVVNAIRHGLTGPGPHRIELALSVDRDEIEVRLVDSGSPFDPRRPPRHDEPADLAAAAIGGRGLGLVNRRTRRLGWRYAGGKNVVDFTIAL